MSRLPLRTGGLVLALTAMTACGGDEPAPPADVPSNTPRAAAPAGAEGAQPPAGNLPEGVTAAQVQQGQQIFTGQGICFTCHASDATGSVLGPNLTDDTWLWVDPAAGDVLTQIATIVQTGVTQPKEHSAPMPAMGGAQLSEAQIAAVAAYVYSLSAEG